MAKLKSGFLSSEFWVLVVTFIFDALAAFGVLSPGGPWLEMSLGAVAFAASRGWVKGKVEDRLAAEAIAKNAAGPE